MPRDTARDPNIGRRLIEQFVLTQRLGGGGMGDVYLAEQPSMGRRAVVKLLHPELSRDPEIAARFNLEARALAALQHPHIVTVYNYGADPSGALFLAMEFLDGTDLDALLRRSGPLPPARAVAIAQKICSALAAAHARGVVHRDLKPSNVILLDGDFVKVLDFGVAKVRGVTLTAAGTVFGTPEYMAPEQLLGQPLDGRCDLYALGVLLFELVAGRLPFVRDTPEAYMAAHLNELPPSLSDFVPVPPELSALVARTLAKAREARPADANEMMQLLEAACAGEPATAVGGKQSDRRRGGRGDDGGGVGAGAGLRAAIMGGTIGLLALVALAIAVLLKKPPAPRLPTELPLQKQEQPALQKLEQPALQKLEQPALQKLEQPPVENIDYEAHARDLERQLMTMSSPLSARERRAALQAIKKRIDAAPGSPADHARLRAQALEELIRQHQK